MLVYSSKYTQDTLFISKGVLLDIIKTLNSTAKPSDIYTYKIDDVDGNNVPYKLYQPAGKSTLSSQKVGHAKEYDVILQKYVSNPKWQNALMKRRKGSRGQYSCKLPADLNEVGMIEAKKTPEIYYSNDMEVFTFDNVRTGLASVTIVDPVKKVVRGKMYTYHLPSMNVAVSEYDKLREGKEGSVPFYEYSSFDTSFTAVKSNNDVVIIFTILEEGKDTIITVPYKDRELWFSDPSAIAFIEAVYNNTIYKDASYYGSYYNKE